ncbi:hypothetical protein OCU04_009007 [Sclerotinia nivalis]|uniref:Uncharacterized protein n=1 Tax=Sclerotinia nivalis TaxID=352851 RepID=A0A9X0AGL9_9HELO|nr:hypothetical protein OCU04_009007 [Sclerotinia nivalis]
MSSAPSDLSLSPDQRYDNDQMIMAWIAALVAEGCPPFAVTFKTNSSPCDPTSTDCKPS